jgi:hypothetical protein
MTETHPTLVEKFTERGTETRVAGEIPITKMLKATTVQATEQTSPYFELAPL